MKAETRVARWGNSVALRLPKRLADRLGLDEGRLVELTVEVGRLVVQAWRIEPRSGDLLAGITPENLPQSFDDRPVGAEAL
jgi:antitoxin MazE